MSSQNESGTKSSFTSTMLSATLVLVAGAIYGLLKAYVPAGVRRRSASPIAAPRTDRTS